MRRKQLLVLKLCVLLCVSVFSFFGYKILNQTFMQHLYFQNGYQFERFKGHLLNFQIFFSEK